MWIGRFKLNEKRDSIQVENQDTESMIIQDEYIKSIVEYAPNKLFLTGKPTCMFLIDNWSNIRCIHDPNSSNN